jgi:very-short-patch-repair endonuclease
MPKRKIIPYNPKLKARAKELRNNSTFTEILLWNHLKKKQLRNYDPAKGGQVRQTKTN